MATAKDHLSALQTNETSMELETNSIIALKWPEETRKTSTFHVVQLSIDSKGYYLICENKVTKELECFDLALVHDTRTDPPPIFPGDDCFDNINFGEFHIPHRLKWLSIYYGDTYVASNELRIIGFYFRAASLVREWAEKLFQLGHRQLLRNLSSFQCLEKLHSRIRHGLIEFGNRMISVRKLIQFLCKNNHDVSKEKKIRDALEYIRLPCQNNLMINPNEFTFERFFHFYMKLMDRRDIVWLFESLGGKHRGFLDRENMKTFLQQQNRTTNERADEIIEKYHQENEFSPEKGMSDESFLRYLMSSENSIVDPKIFDLHMNMSKPLAHYFIASSHNTYLAGSQLTGRASVEMYRQVLLTGCRSIELDVVDSDKKDDEPEIKHVRTPVRPVLFRDVIHAIKEYAFKVTPYPLTLSIENHCSAKVQVKMAQYFVEILGDYLLREPLRSHPVDENTPLPSPNDLRYKILIKNKKLQPKANPKSKLSTLPQAVATSSHSSGQGTDISTEASVTTPSSVLSEELFRRISSTISQAQENPRHGTIFDDEGVSEDEKGVHTPEMPPKVPETRATGAMSDLVVYLIPISNKAFPLADEYKRSYRILSLSEDRGQSVIREYPTEFYKFNQRQISRIYPRGTRFESSNYNPYAFWRMGCQMVALNYQTLDIPMQLNLGLFSLNNNCGYIEKPSALCQFRDSFNPRTLKHLEDVVSYQIDLKVLSGQFLCQDREPTFVDVQIHGMYGEETKRLEYRLRAKRWNGFQAIYDENELGLGELPISFPPVILPEMAAIRFSVTGEDGGWIGQCFLPVAHLRPGYRHIVLRNQINLPINCSSLFIFVRRTISVSPKNQELVPPSTNQSPKATHLHQQLSSNLLLRMHPISSNDIQENFQRQRNSSDTIEEISNYQRHVLASSKLNNSKNLCQILSLHDIHPKEIVKREQNIQSKLRRLSMDFQGDIQKEEDRFRLFLNRGMIRNHSSNGAINQKNLEEIGECLIQLYCKKFTLQGEFERKQINEYYKNLEKEITADFEQKRSQIRNILKKEKSRLNELVREQSKKEGNQLSKNEKDREKISIFKQKCLEKHTKIGDLTCHILDNMFEETQENLQVNLQINLMHLEEEKTKEMEVCWKKYSDGLERIRRQVQDQIPSH